ncbi:MAG TPA: TlpA disulfide reductase family protein [Kofleriaceae bacterium]|nr:TlpA disulfide reductase family protein [Kofleriaceae bacterium]
MALGALAAAACDRTDKPVAPAPRTNVARVSTTQAATTEAFCDRHTTDDRGAVFRWPDLAAGQSAPAAPTTWRWVNLWATWCKPCIEEMPRLLAWRDKLAASGKRVELAFVSVDDADAEVDAFRKDHPGTPASIRIVDADKRSAWLKGLGLDDGAIPIHLFVSPANRLRCARAGGIRENDYDIIAKLLGE